MCFFVLKGVLREETRQPNLWGFFFCFLLFRKFSFLVFGGCVYGSCLDSLTVATCNASGFEPYKGAIQAFERLFVRGPAISALEMLLCLPSSPWYGSRWDLKGGLEQARWKDTDNVGIPGRPHHVCGNLRSQRTLSWMARIWRSGAFSKSLVFIVSAIHIWTILGPQKGSVFLTERN